MLTKKSNSFINALLSNTCTLNHCVFLPISSQNDLISIISTSSNSNDGLGPSLTFGVMAAAMYGDIIPGIVAVVFVIPNKIPANL